MRRSEIRKDFIVDRYVIISPGRDLRPVQIAQSGEPPVDTTKSTCVFCPPRANNIASVYRVGRGKKHWDIDVVQNKYPAVSLDNPRAYGVQEVVIETPDHTKQLEDLPIAHIVKLFRVYATRTRMIQRNKMIQYILIFKNSGGRAGASIQHSHSQIFATAFIPPHLLHRSEKARAYRLLTRRCAYCDMIKREERSPRLVYQDKLVSVFCPYASENNYEVWILPRRHIDNVTLLNDKERAAFARHVKILLAKITQLQLPYNYYFHQVINDDDQHLYLRIRPRGTVWAGVEIGSGIIINPVPPEVAAKYFRK